MTRLKRNIIILENLLRCILVRAIDFPIRAFERMKYHRTNNQKRRIWSNKETNRCYSLNGDFNK